MTEILISKQCLVLEGFGHWIFEFEFYLKFGAWNLYFLEQYSKAEPSISNSRNAGVFQDRIKYFMPKYCCAI